MPILGQRTIMNGYTRQPCTVRRIRQRRWVGLITEGQEPCACGQVVQITSAIAPSAYVVHCGADRFWYGQFGDVSTRRGPALTMRGCVSSTHPRVFSAGANVHKMCISRSLTKNGLLRIDTEFRDMRWSSYYRCLLSAPTFAIGKVQVTLS